MNPYQLITESLLNLPQILDHYEEILVDWAENLKIEGKTLELANREQPGWLAYYDECRIQLKSVVKYIEDQVEKVRGEEWVRYTEKYSRELSYKDKDRYVCKETTYLSKREILHEATELYDRFDGIVRAFEARGYALKNITEARIHQLSDVVL